MAFLDTFLASNLVQVAATFAVGSLVAWLISRDSRLVIMKAITGYIALSVLASFVFNVGEVYQYAPYYKRAFSLFGDDIGTVLLIFILPALFYRESGWYYVAFTALLLTLGKTSLLLFALAVIALALINRTQARQIGRRVLIGILIAVPLYFAAGAVGNIQAVREAGVAFVARVNNLPVPKAIDPYSLLELNMAIHKQKGWIKLFVATVQSPHFCADLGSCIYKEGKGAITERFYSTIGGLWMTLQGGFRGDAYPHTAEAFATMMMQANPWGINDRFDLTYAKWKHMAMPQNPYAHFGSGYGPLLLLGLLLAWGAIIVVGARAVRRGQRGIDSSYAVYFWTVVLFDQTQPYITAFSSIMFALGLAAGMIVLHAWQQARGLPARPYSA